VSLVICLVLRIWVMLPILRADDVNIDSLQRIILSVDRSRGDSQRRQQESESVLRGRRTVPAGGGKSGGAGCREHEILRRYRLPECKGCEKRRAVASRIREFSHWCCPDRSKRPLPGCESRLPENAGLHRRGTAAVLFRTSWTTTTANPTARSPPSCWQENEN